MIAILPALGGSVGKPSAIIALVLLALGSYSGPSFLVHGVPSGKYFDYSVTILMENNDLQTVLSQGSFEATHASNYTLATGYSAITHPSEPNYVALLGGSTNGIAADGVCCYTIQAPNLVDRLEFAGLTWKAFAENATGSGTCSFTPPRRGDHFPFIVYSDMNTQSRCAGFDSTSAPEDPEFINYLNSPQPANYIWLTPNDLDNGHNSPYITGGDAYLATLVPKILVSSLFRTEKAALFIVYDEGRNVRCSTGGLDCIYASWSGPTTKKAFTSSEPYTHYSYLHTVEDNWGLSSITPNDANASLMSEFFTGSPTGPAGSCPFCLPTGSLWILAIVVVLVTAVSPAILMVRSRRRRVSR